MCFKPNVGKGFIQYFIYKNLFIMRKLYVVFVLLLCVSFSALAQSANFNNTFLILNTNGAGNQYYDLNAATSNPDFQGTNLGTFTQGVSTLVYVGAEHNVTKCGSCDITATGLHYYVHPVFAGPPPPPGFLDDNVLFNSTAGNGCGGQNQVWQNTGGTTNLLAGLIPGNYVMEVYSDMQTTCLGAVYASNGGANYIATFSVVCNPATLPSASIAATPVGAICAGTNVSFTATPNNGGAAPSYQWYVGATPVGTNSATFASNTLANGDAVSVVMTSNDPLVCAGSLTVTSNTITETVNPNLPASVTIAPSPTGTICAGTSVTFTATPTNGGGAPTYQWQVNGTNVATGATYTTTTLINTDVVTVEMTSNATPCLTGSPATSAGITMTVNPNLPASVTIAASPVGAICAGTSVTFTPTPTNGGAAPTYQWKVNGTNVATGATYTTTTLINTDVVTVEMTSNATPCLTGSPATSAGITMTVNPLHTISLTSGSNTPTLCINTLLGTNIVYTIGGGATSAGVTGLPAGMVGTLSGTTYTISGTPTASGSFLYTVTTTGNGCTVATATGTITV